jgi:hypothetical protein
MGIRSVLAVIFLAGCAVEPDVPRPGDGVAVIAASGFSGLYGGAFVDIWADDTVELRSIDLAEQTDVTRRAVIPGAFAAATDAVTRLGPAARRIPATEPGECMDYGEDIVRATPPVSGFAEAVSACPAEALSALSAAIFAIAAPLGD